LCVGGGERITANTFSAKILSWNSEHFSCRWGLRDFRQGTITMAHEFISGIEKFAEADSILAESSDHSTSIELGHYGVIHGAVPRLSNNTLWHHRWVRDEWGSFLGLGPLPPQEPIRRIQMQKGIGAGAAGAESIAKQVAKTTESILTSFFTNDLKKLIHDSVTSALQEGFKRFQSGGQFDVDVKSNLDDLFYDHGDGEP
jgi:hypothetical protein